MTNIKKIIYIIFISCIFFTEANSEIEDSLFATVGNKAITHSDIVNEIKLILIVNGQTWSEERREELQTLAINQTIKRNIKKIEIEKYKEISFDQTDVNRELEKIAANLNTDLFTFQNIMETNEVDIETLIDQIKTESLWNSLIFNLYKNRISINTDEVDEQLKMMQSNKNPIEYLLSEMIVKTVPKDELDSKIKEIKNKINTEGFDKVAMDLSLAETAIRGGDLGWVNENIISTNFRSEIENTPAGKISEPILLPEGILFFHVRDKREVEKSDNLEMIKRKLVDTEKKKILNMHSISHYENLKRTVTINYY